MKRTHLPILIAFLTGLAVMGLLEVMRQRPRPPSHGTAPGGMLTAARGADAGAGRADAGAPPAEGVEVLRGAVRSAGAPAANVRILVGAGDGMPREGRTDAEGRFLVSGLAAGSYAVRAIGAGAGALREGVRVGAGAPELALELGPAPAVEAHVLDDEGRPVAGVEALLGEPLASLPLGSRSDGQGALRFAAVPPGRYELSVRGEGWVPAAAAVRVGPTGASGPAPVLRLRRGAILVGEVVDQDQRPVEGAHIGLISDDGASLPTNAPPPGHGAGGPRLVVEPAGELGIVRGPIPYPPLGDHAPVGEPPRTGSIGPIGPASASASSGPPGPVSDAAGRFRIADLPPGHVSAAASHPAYAEAAPVSVTLAAGLPATVRLVLRRALSLRGRVVDPRGEGVPGAEVWIDGALSATCDGSGRFEATRLGGPVDLEVRARGHAAARRHVDPATEPQVELALGEATQRLVGVVVDARGFPVAGARVSVEAPGGERRTGSTDRQGGFTIDGCPSGPLNVAVSHGEHLRTTVIGAQSGDDLRVTLSPGGVVEGELVADRGGAVPSSRVSLDDATGEHRTATPDRSGRFRIAGCAPGPATLRAEAPGYLPASAPVDLPSADYSGDVVLRDVRFALLEAGSVTGRVSDDKGLPVVGAVVEAAGASTRTDDSGRFRLGPVPVGRLELSARSAVGTATESVDVDRHKTASVELRLR